MTEPHEPDTAPDATCTDERADRPPPASVWISDHEPTTEAERQVTETVRSISRLEEGN